MKSLFGFKRKNIKEETSFITDDMIVSPVDGEIVEVSAVDDPVFSSKLMGESIALRIKGSKVILCAPCNGHLTAIFPTGHAYGITMNDGVEILVHCGINTVQSKGEGFKILNEQGTFVLAGDPIIEVDVTLLSKYYDMTTLLIVTNAQGKLIHFQSPRKMIHSGDIITV